MDKFDPTAKEAVSRAIFEKKQTGQSKEREVSEKMQGEIDKAREKLEGQGQPGEEKQELSEKMQEELDKAREALEEKTETESAGDSPTENSETKETENTESSGFGSEINDIGNNEAAQDSGHSEGSGSSDGDGDGE